MRYNRETINNAPELVALCTHCKHADCIGTCPECRARVDELLGVCRPEKGKRGGARPNSGRRRKLRLEAFGETHTLREWADRYKVSYYALYKRVYIDSHPIEEALLMTPGHRGGRPPVLLRVDGREMPIPAWAKELGIPPNKIHARLKLGWSAREALFGKEKKH